MQAFLSSLGRAVTSVVVLVAGAIFAFSLLVAGLFAALLLGVAALLSGGRIKARRFRMPQRPGAGPARRGEVVDVEVREVADPPPPPIDR